jgi:hypothetical protein
VVASFHDPLDSRLGVQAGIAFSSEGDLCRLPFSVNAPSRCCSLDPRKFRVTGFCLKVVDCCPCFGQCPFCTLAIFLLNFEGRLDNGKSVRRRWPGR